MDIKFNIFSFLILHICEKIESHWSKLFKASAGERPRNEEENQTFLSPVSSGEIKKGKGKKLLAQIPKTFPLPYNTAKKIRGRVEGRGKKGTVLQRHAYQQRELWILLRKPLETSDHAPLQNRAKCLCGTKSLFDCSPVK